MRHPSRHQGNDRIDQLTLVQIRNHYLGALALGETTNSGDPSPVAQKARVRRAVSPSTGRKPTNWRSSLVR
jgi:hypothetical protein